MSKRFFDYDPTTGVRTEFEDTDEGFNLHYTQDAEPLLDRNKAVQNSGAKQADDNFWHAASIPASVQMKWLVEHGIDVYNPDHSQGVKRLLNDPEWRHLRTWKFQI